LAHPSAFAIGRRIPFGLEGVEGCWLRWLDFNLICLLWPEQLISFGHHYHSHISHMATIEQEQKHW